MSAAPKLTPTKNAAGAHWLGRLVRALRARHYCWKTGGHVDRFVRNIYGDEINARNGMRSEWKCNCCGRWKLRPELNHTAPEFRSTNSQDRAREA